MRICACVLAASILAAAAVRADAAGEPAPTDNLAPRAKVTVSGHLDAKEYPASRINDGRIDVGDKSQRWISSAKTPSWVELAWQQPQTIGAVRVVNGYWTGGRPGSPISDLVVRTESAGRWADIPGSSVKGNTSGDLRVTFRPVRARRIRIWITKTHSDMARIYEVEVYGRLPQLPRLARSAAGRKRPDDTQPSAAAVRPLHERVDEAIDKAVAYLLKVQRPDGTWMPEYRAPHMLKGNEVGPTALVVYALVESGVSIQKPEVAKALAWLTRRKELRTYTLAARACAYFAADRQAPGKFASRLSRDVRMLVVGTRRGAYDYELGEDHGSTSNDHLGALGVWVGKQANLEIPRAYWAAVHRYWAGMQRSDGGWTYSMGPARRRKPLLKGGPSSASMTAGGVATLFVCNDCLNAAQFVRCGGGELHPNLRKGLDWLDKHLADVLSGKREERSFSYSLYAIERAALASGYKYFGTTDWYKAGAKRALTYQTPSGCMLCPGQFRDPIVDTCFTLLFLIRGRQAVVMNKLEFDGDWNNRPRDLAMMTRWLGRTFERPVHWQIVKFAMPLDDWHDAPILYISGAKAPKFSERELAKLRQYVDQGGTILSVAECGGLAFRKAIRETYRKLFPKYELTRCPRDHPVYSAHFRVPGRPTFEIVSNGVRPLAIHTDADLALPWQTGRSVTQQWAFRTAANLAMYVSDTIASLRPRGASHWPTPRRFQPRATVKLARLKHAGNYDPEPLAYERLRILLGNAEQVRLTVAGPLAIEELPSSPAAIATLTGTGKLELTDGERAVLKRFVEGGGTLIVDAAGGRTQFADSAAAILHDLFGAQSIRRFAASAPPLKVGDREVGKVRYRGKTRARLGGSREPNLRGALVGGRTGVIFSREDLTAGLVGYESSTVDGYAPRSAYEIMRNIVLWVAGRQAKASSQPARRE